MSFNFSKYRYDAWIHWNITAVCNLNCSYCFGHIDTTNKIEPIKIKDLIKTLTETGRTFRISFTGGEPLLVPNIVEACESITENHFISLNTNLMSKKILSLAKKINPGRVVRIHASFHYDELKNKNLLKTFIDRIKFLQDNDFPVHVEAVAFPPYVSDLPIIKNTLLKEGINLQFGPYFGSIGGKKYPESYTDKDLMNFGFGEEIRSVFKLKGIPCNAGYNAFIAYRNGDLHPCFQISENSGNLYERIVFSESIRNCPHQKCGCPLNIYDEGLYKKSLEK